MSNTEEDEESPESGEEAAEDGPLSDDDVESIVVDAEVLVRSGAEKIDYLVERGRTEFVGLRDRLDKVWNEILAKIPD